MKKVNILTKKRKGQVSLFIVVGLVMLMFFAAVFYLVNSMTAARIEREVKKTTSSVLTTNTMQYYVSDCLVEILKEGLITIGKQGGYFYENQSGYEFTTELPRVEFKGANVSYLIYPRGGYYRAYWPCSSAYNLNEPAYCRFSTEAFPANDRYGVGFGSSRLPFMATSIYSIQSQLAKYLQDEISKCINFTTLSEQFPGYNISGGEIEMEMLFGTNNVNVKLNYPIRMQFQDYEPILELYGFKAEVPVRFSKMYDLAEKMLDREVFFLDSDPIDEAINLLQYSPEIRLRIEKQGFDDIFIINDSYSQIDGKNYIFQFARKNRPPVLDYIGRSPSYLYNESSTDTELYDYLAVPLAGLDQVIITPSAIDPDEDPVFYSSQSDIPALTSPDIENSISYAVNESDIGFHNITVVASDLNFTDLDRQRVRLLVDKPLKPNATLINPYGANVNHIYSREDPFFLNATPSIKSLDPFAAYAFTWVDSASNVRLKTGHNCIVLPTGEDCTDYEINIENITEYDQKNYLSAPGTNSVFLRVNLSYTGLSQVKDAEIPVTRMACVPYRSDTVPPYPYNKPAGIDLDDFKKTKEAFLGDHACCNDDGTIIGIETVCHQKFRCSPNDPGLRKHIWNVYCNGTRGNICNGRETDAGISDICGCPGTDPECNNRKANGFTNGVWCYGTEGCSEACTAGGLREAVANADGDVIDCGCSGNKDAKCDGDFDGIFEGTCTGLTGGYSCQT